MDIESFFGNRDHDHKNYREPRYQDSPGYSQNRRHSHQRQGPNFKLMYFLENLKNNRKLKLIVLVAFIMILVIVIALIAVFLPLILKLLHYISQNGVQGLMDYITEFLDKLWKGSGK